MWRNLYNFTTYRINKAIVKLYNNESNQGTYYQPRVTINNEDETNYM